MRTRRVRGAWGLVVSLCLIAPLSAGAAKPHAGKAGGAKPPSSKPAPPASPPPPPPAAARPRPEEIDAALGAAYDEANRLYRAGEYAAALAAYDKAEAMLSTPEITYGRARCLHMLGKLPEAAAAYEKFLVDAPTHSGAPKARGYLEDALGTMGARALDVGDYEHAREIFERALALHAVIDPKAADAATGVLLVGLGESLAGLGDKDAAIAMFDKALHAAIMPEMRKQAEHKILVLKGLAPESEPAPRKRIVLWIGIGGGAVAVVAAAVVVGVLLAARKPAPDTPLGTFDVGLAGERP
jgi:TolA-binding protein